MTRPMASKTEQKLLELVANAVGFEYLMYVPASFPQRSGLLYKREHGRMSVWNPLVDDGDLFRLAVAAPAVNQQMIINSVSRPCQGKLEIRCACVHGAFVQAVATRVIDSCSIDGAGSEGASIAVGEGYR